MATCTGLIATRAGGMAAWARATNIWFRVAFGLFAAGLTGGPASAVGPIVARIVSVLAVAFLLSLAGIILLGLTGGDADVRATLTQVLEVVLGLFLGIAAGRLVRDE